MPRDPRAHPLDDRIRALHMLQAAREARQFCHGRSRPDLDTDMLLRRAVVHCLQEIGEAAARVSPRGQARLPGVPWPQIVGMRHRLVHAYFTINLDLVWTVVSDDLPGLIAALETALAAWPMPPTTQPPPQG